MEDCPDMLSSQYYDDNQEIWLYLKELASAGNNQYLYLKKGGLYATHQIKGQYITHLKL